MKKTEDITFKKKFIGKGILRMKYQTLKQGEYLINIKIDN